MNIAELKRRVRNLLIAADQFAYVAGTLGHGEPDETISSALYRAELKGRLAAKYGRAFVDWLWVRFGGPAEHCKKAYENEIRRRHLPAEMRVAP
jgi:hypothetical protein